MHFPPEVTLYTADPQAPFVNTLAHLTRVTPLPLTPPETLPLTPSLILAGPDTIGPAIALIETLKSTHPDLAAVCLSSLPDPRLQRTAAQHHTLLFDTPQTLDHLSQALSPSSSTDV